MGLYGALQASVSGMAAQSNKLSAISQNIANSDTTGYKNVEAQFEDLVSSADQNNFNGAGVTTSFNYLNSVQGSYTTTSTTTNMAVDGNGFFVVQNASGAQFLTRDGDFTQDAAGNLTNDAGYTLMGYSLASGAASSVANGSAGLVPVNVSSSALSQNPTTSGTLSVNVPSTATAVTTAADLPSANAATSTYTDKTSLVTYDNLGAPVTLDVYMTKTGTGTWDLDVYNQADATNGGFPYSTAALTSQTLNFSSTTGDITSATNNTTNASTPLSAVPINIPGGQTLNLNISGMTQLAAAYTTTTATVNGNAPSGVSSVSIAANGTLSAVYADGTEAPLFDIPLANVPSPDSLTPISGNVFQLNSQSGDPVYGTPGQGGLGTLQSSTLESSTVDLATELTNMISAQSGYEANSKVFSTGTTLLEDLVNLVK
jgi:flagellar hook protein FlgE